MKYLLLAIVFLTSFSVTSAASTFLVVQGGTGATTFSSGQLLYGSGTNPIKSVATTTASCSGSASCTSFTVIGSSPITISATGGGGSFPFSADTNYGQTVYSTSTPTLWLKSGLFASSTSQLLYASTTAVSATNFYGALTGNASTATALAANGTNCSAGSYPLGVDASGNSESCTVASTGTVTAVTGTWPIISSGGATPNFTWGGIATSSAISAASGLLYSTGVNTFASVSTSSPVSMSISGNAATVTTNANLSGAVTSSGSNVTSFGSLGAGVLGTPITGVPSAQATSTLYGTGTGGKVLGWNSTTGGIAWVATSTAGSGSGTVGSATLAGQTPYYAASGTTLTATSSIFVDTNQYIGIGNSTAGTVYARLQVTDATVNSNAVGQLQLMGNDAQAVGKGGTLDLAGIYDSSNNVATFAQVRGLKENSTDSNYAGYMAFYTRPNGSGITERARITSTGSVGIGTTSPESALEIRTSSTVNGIYLTDTAAYNASPGQGIGIRGKYNAAGALTRFNVFSGAKENTIDGDQKGAISLYVNNGSALSEALHISSTGNVGIGTTTPGTKFVVSGASMDIFNATTPFIYAKWTDTTSYGGIGFEENGNLGSYFLAIGSNFSDATRRSNMSFQAYNGMEFWTYQNTGVPLRVMDLSAAGKVGIGTTTPVANLQITASAANATTSVQFGKANQNKGTCVTYYDTAGTPLYGFIGAGATAFTYTATKPSGCQN